MVKHTVCTIPGCGKKHRARGFCHAHYSRHYRGSSIDVETRGMARSIDHEDGTRTCAACGVRSALANFYPSRGCARGRRASCKSCCRARDAARRAVVPHVYYELDRLSFLRRRARLSGVEFDRAVTHDSLRARDGDACAYCGVAMDFTPARRGRHVPTKATIDHVRPVSRGGPHTFDNTVLACLSCNFSKNAKPVGDWAPAG